MAIMKCEYCGTPYDPDREICPLCGIPEDEYVAPAPAPKATPTELPIATKSREHREPNPTPQTRKKEKVREKPVKEKEDGMPKALVVLICIVLTLTVILSVGFFLLKIGVFDLTPPSSSEDSNLDLPFEEKEPEAEEEVAAPGEVIACTGLDVDYKEINLFGAGEFAQLKAKTTPANTTEAVVWSSSDEEVCTVDQDGRITAVGGGVAIVTATCGEKATSSTISCVFDSTVVAPETTDPKPETSDEEIGDFTAVLNLTDFSLFSEGETAQLELGGVPDGVEANWSIANEAVATLKDGLVTAVSAGTTKVTVTVGDQKLECIVRCNLKDVENPENAETVVTGNETLSHSDVTMSTGEKFVLSLEGTASEAVWSVGNTGVCTISSGGTVTATGSGTTEISTKVGDKTLTCIVRVN